MWAPHLPAKEALQTEVEHFIDCCLTGASPISNGITGLQVVRILEAASRSIQSRGNPVHLGNEVYSFRRTYKPVQSVSELGQMLA
jgi:predicted dehydrogenase